MAITKAENERRLRTLVGNRLNEAARLADVDLLRAELKKGRSLNRRGLEMGLRPCIRQR
jgi:phosphoribosyl-dephospho-CoA transferase